MNVSRRLRRWLMATVALAALAVLVSACGSSGSTTSTPSPSGNQSSSSSVKQTGPGLNEPTKGSGARIKGGTITFAEAAAAPPNYIFPMYSAEYCGTNNNNMLNILLYRPLYWYGNNYDPTVDLKDSIGKKPVFSNGGKTVTVHLNHYMWSNGEQVSARDIVFWMNVLKADPGKEWCGYVAGKFPDNVVSYKAVNTTTFQMTMNRAYNPTWVQYNVLSQIYPMPLAWDKTSLSGPTPSPTSTSAPDLTKSGAASVYNFLNTQGQKINTWATSPLWSVVDGPWKLQSTTSNGQVTFVPNKDYSGPTKASISKFVEVPFTSESAMVDQIKDEGAKSLSIAYVPPQYEPLVSQFEGQGYSYNKASGYEINFFPLNFNNPTVGPIFRQLYFRQAFQHLVDQEGWIEHFLHNTAVQTYSPVPTAPPSTILSGASSSSNPFPFSVEAASKLLKSHGWKVAPGGQSVCEKPGTASDECGQGVKKNQPLAITIDYESGDVSVQQEMEDLQSQASKVGIKISLTSHPFDDVYSAAVHCTPKQPGCKWEVENWGGGWTYGPDYYPTGEDLFGTGAIANYSNYSDPAMDALINKTITSSAAAEATNMKAFVSYTEKELPVVWGPTSVGTFIPSAGTLISSKIGGYSANALSWLSPEDWYLTK
jgi:peptide/nickel transport system substrate-binding protein